MKEEKPILQNQISSIPIIATSHKIQLLQKSDDNIDIALAPHKSSSIIVDCRNKDDDDDDDDDDKERIEVETSDEDSGRERLKRHRVEVAGKVWIPDTWGQEDLLKDWIDCSAFDSSLVPKGLMSARDALAQEGRRALSGSLGVQNSC